MTCIHLSPNSSLEFLFLEVYYFLPVYVYFICRQKSHDHKTQSRKACCGHYPRDAYRDVAAHGRGNLAAHLPQVQPQVEGDDEGQAGGGKPRTKSLPRFRERNSSLACMKYPARKKLMASRPVVLRKLPSALAVMPTAST